MSTQNNTRADSVRWIIDLLQLHGSHVTISIPRPLRGQLPPKGLTGSLGYQTLSTATTTTKGCTSLLQLKLSYGILAVFNVHPQHPQITGIYGLQLHLRLLHYRNQISKLLAHILC